MCRRFNWKRAKPSTRLFGEIGNRFEIIKEKWRMPNMCLWLAHGKVDVVDDDDDDDDGAVSRASFGIYYAFFRFHSHSICCVYFRRELNVFGRITSTISLGACLSGLLCVYAWMCVCVCAIIAHMNRKNSRFWHGWERGEKRQAPRHLIE